MSFGSILWHGVSSCLLPVLSAWGKKKNPPKTKKTLVWWTESLLGSFILIYIYRLILSYILSPFEWKLGQESPCVVGENWWIGIFWDSGTSLVPLPWCRSFLSHQGAKPDLFDVNIFAFICKPGVVVKLNDEVTLALVSLQLLLLLAEHCNSYLVRMDPGDEERIDKVVEEGSRILVLPGRSNTGTVWWLLFSPRYIGEKEWARIFHLLRA